MMALSRIRGSADFATLFARSSYAASKPHHQRRQTENLHATSVRRYPEAPTIPLPSNVSEIFNTETSRFAPERIRDITTPVLLYSGNGVDKFTHMCFGHDDHAKMHQLDSHVDSYDCFGAISLNGSMQTNVPKPFCSSGKSTYLNMPGGMWARDEKYLAENIRKSHFTVYQMRQVKRSGGFDGPAFFSTTLRYYSTAAPGGQQSTQSTTAKSQPQSPTEATSQTSGDRKLEEIYPPEKTWEEMTKRERLQIVVKQYGPTVIVFHVTLSLISLGIFYSIVSSGLDITPVIKWFSQKEGPDDALVTTIMGTGSTFLIAYGVHKLFAPVRISITLGLTPMIVKYLRRKGILRRPQDFGR